MPCTCNAICDSDCAANTAVCTGHVPVCSNDYSFTSVISTTLIILAHIQQLETAINAERNNGGRRYNAAAPVPCASHTSVACTNNDFSSYPFTSAAGIAGAANADDVIAANNEVTVDSGYGATIVINPNIGDLITAANLLDLQTKINQTRDVCICDSHCSCDPADCGCNGECPSDDYYYYYYYYP